MLQTTRDQITQTLEQGWGTYVERFQRMDAAQQAAFLQKQGFARLADLLGHVVAWWQDAIPSVSARLADPTLPPKDYDIDAFNARAVQRFAGKSDEEMIALFESTRETLLAFIRDLPADALDDKGVHFRLGIEVVGHLDEHAMENPPHPMA